MKKYIIIVFLLLASASYAQPPRIDSMLVDESKSELHIYGSFGSAEGKVWVDSVEMVVKSWADNLITTSIPDTGKGSAGSVIVENSDNLFSKERALTLWHGYKWMERIEHHSFPTITSYTIDFFLRMDLSSMIEDTNKIIRIGMPVKRTTLNETFQFNTPYDPAYGYDTRETVDGTLSLYDTSSNYDKGFNCLAYFSNAKKTISFFIFNVKGLTKTITSRNGKGDTSNYTIDTFSSDFKLDSNYKINFSTYDYYDGLLFSYSVKINGAYFFPPNENIFALQYKPYLILPLSGTIYTFNNITKLIWDSLSLMTGYRLQVSSDSLFKTKAIDTITSSLNFSLPALTGLTQYFWRVAGVNSEGESRWSDVWNFWTGLTSADVLEVQNDKLNLTAFPNPSSKELNITYSLPENGNARIILYDLQGRVIRETANNFSVGEQQMKWDVSHVASGCYVLGLITDNERKAEIVRIVH